MSVNDGAGNCQLLYGADSENPELLHEDEHFDYYVLLQPNRVSINRANAVITMTCIYWKLWIATVHGFDSENAELLYEDEYFHSLLYTTSI